MIDRCFKCGAATLLLPENIAHTAWQCVCDCGAASHSARNKKAPWTTGIRCNGSNGSSQKKGNEMARYRTIKKHAEETGYTESAIRTKISRGVWLEGRVWKKAPDGTIIIDEEGYNEWVENGNGLAMNRNVLESSPFRKHRSRSVSRSEESIAVNVSSSSPLPLT